MKIFVTGFHRAGTHGFSEKLAKDTRLSWIEEGVIGFDSLRHALLLKEGIVEYLDEKNGKVKRKSYPEFKKGFVCQCPGLAHEAEELSKNGTVYWVTRNKTAILTSMYNGSISMDMTWHYLMLLKKKFPTDEVWKQFQYTSTEDAHHGWIKLHTFFVNVKEYLYNKYLANFTTKIILEKEPIYNIFQTATYKNPLKQKHIDMIKEQDKLCLS